METARNNTKRERGLFHWIRLGQRLHEVHTRQRRLVDSAGSVSIHTHAHAESPFATGIPLRTPSPSFYEHPFRNVQGLNRGRE